MPLQDFDLFLQDLNKKSASRRIPREEVLGSVSATEVTPTRVDTVDAVEDPKGFIESKIFDPVKERFTEGATQYTGAFSDPSIPGPNVAEAISGAAKIGGALFEPVARPVGKATGKVIGAIGDAGLEGLKKGVGIMDFLTGPLQKILTNQISKDEGRQEALSDLQNQVDIGLNTLIDKYQNIPEEDKKILMESVAAGANVADLIGRFEGAKFIKPGVKKVVTKSVKIADDALKAVGKTPAKIRSAPGAIKARGEQFARGEISKISQISKPNAKKFVDEFGETPATFMQDRAVLGKEPEMVTKLANNWNNLFKAKREGLDLIPGKFTDLPEVDRALLLIKEKIDDIPGVRSTSLIAKDKATINQLSNKIKSEGVTVSEIDEIKRIFERNNKIPSSVDLTVGSKIKALNTEVDGNLRGVVEDLAEKGGMPNIREINKEIRANRRLADLVDGRGIEDGGLTAIDTLLIRYAVVNPNILAGLAISKTATSNVVRRFIAKKLSPKGAKEITPERIGKLIDLEDINLRADLFLESKQLKDAINKGVMKKVTKEQIENALISDDLIKSGVKLGEGFKILPDEKKILDTMTINQKTASLIKKVKGDIREFKLDPQDADKLATKFDKGGFSSLATKLRKYSDDINKGLIDEADNVIKSLTIELDDSAKQLGKRIARVKGLNRLDLPSAINFLEKSKKAPKLLVELKQLDSIFDESFGKITDISVDEFFTKAVDTINL